MMKQKAILYIWMLVFNASCGQRIEMIESFNDRPRIIIEGMEGLVSFTDSMKVSLKSTPEGYFIRFSAHDVNGNLSVVRFNHLSGRGELFQGNNPVPGPLLDLDREDMDLKYLPQLPGRHVLEFIAEDDFGEQDTFVLQLIAFENLPPVSVLHIFTPSEAVDAGERILDASGSFDGDRAFGGSVVAYEFLVLGELITLNQSSIPVIFPPTGSYEVEVRVMDNDGAWSDPVRQRTVVE